MNVESEVAHLRGSIFDGCLGTSRSAGSRANVLRQKRELPVGIVIAHSSSLDRLELLHQLSRKVLLRIGGLRDGVRRCRFWFGGLLLVLCAKRGCEADQTDCNKCAVEAERVGRVSRPAINF